MRHNFLFDPAGVKMPLWSTQSTPKKQSWSIPLGRHILGSGMRSSEQSRQAPGVRSGRKTALCKSNSYLILLWGCHHSNSVNNVRGQSTSVRGQHVTPIMDLLPCCVWDNFSGSGCSDAPLPCPDFLGYDVWKNRGISTWFTSLHCVWNTLNDIYSDGIIQNYQN